MAKVTTLAASNRKRHTTKSGWLFIVLATVLLISNLLYMLWLRPLVPALYEGSAPGLLQHLVEEIYPRLAVEKQRFNVTFFLSRADQVLFRFNLAFILLLVCLNSRQAFGKWFIRLASRRDLPVQQAVMLRIFFYCCMIGFTLDWYQYLHEYGRAVAFYKPVWFLKILAVPYPGPCTIKIMFGLFITFAMLSAAGIKTVVFSCLSALLFQLQWAFLSSFEKINHTYATFGFVALLMPLLLYQQQKGARYIKRWPLFYIQAAIAGGYFFSGLEKLLISGAEWLNAGTTAFYLSTKHAAAANQLLNFPVILNFSVILILIWQVTFPVILFKKNLRIWYLPAGLVFHISTVALLKVGALVNPWVFLYVFFLDMPKSARKLFDRLYHLTCKQFSALAQPKAQKRLDI